MKITPTKIHAGTFSAPYRVPFGWRRFIYDTGNRVFEIMDNLELRPCGTLAGFARKDELSGAAFHPQKEMAAYLTENGMAVSDFNGTILWEYKTPAAALLFSRNGEELWIAEKIDKDTLRVSVCDAYRGMENSVVAMKDPFYDSSLILYHAPGTVLMGLAAGQDGCAIWALDDAEAVMKHRDVFPHKSFFIPAFHPDGGRLLDLENDEQLFYTYDWPAATLIARQRDFTEAKWNDEEGEALPGFSLVYLKNGQAVVQSASYRFYLFDPEKMARLEELVIDGFEPLPTKEIFPRLEDDESLCSQLVSLERMGDVLIARTGKEIKNQALLLFTEDELFRQIMQ